MKVKEIWKRMLNDTDRPFYSGLVDFVIGILFREVQKIKGNIAGIFSELK